MGGSGAAARTTENRGIGSFVRAHARASPAFVSFAFMTLLQSDFRLSLPSGVELPSSVSSSQESILTPAALSFVADLERYLRPGLKAIRQRRRIVQAHLEEGRRLVLSDPPARPRGGDWQAAPAPNGLRDLRIGIHGPAHREFLIPALDSKAPMLMVDVAEPAATTWEHVLEAHVDLCDAVDRMSRSRDPEDRRFPALAIRPRGLGTDETGLHVDGEPVASALFDAAMYLVHNAQALQVRGQTPTLVVAGVQVRQEAEWWSALCARAESILGLPYGTVRVILLQDDVLGAFDFDDLLWGLRERIVAVALQRTGYLASWLRCLGHEPGRLLPDPRHLGHTSAFLTAWRQLVVRTAHRRAIRVLGERSEHVSMTGDTLGNPPTVHRMRRQARREVSDGMAGDAVASRGFVPFVRQVFDVFDTAWPPSMEHEMDPSDDTGEVTAADLLQAPGGSFSLAGLLRNLELVVRWEEASLRRQGNVRLGRVSFDAAEVELARRHLLQWLRLDAQLGDGSTVTPELVEQELQRTLGRVHADIGSEAFEAGCYPQAVRIVQILLGSEVSH